MRSCLSVRSPIRLSCKSKSLTEFKKGIKEAEQTKDEFVNDVKEVKDEVAKEAKKASGIDEIDTSS